MRRTYLDIARIAACFLVIVNHTNSRIFLAAEPSGLWVVSVTYFFISKIAVPVFLLVSGDLLLGRRESYKKTASRFLRILGALVLFSLVYYLIDCAAGARVFGVGNFFLAVLKHDITNCFWYLYLYLALMVMLPALQAMATGFNKRDFVYFIFITIIIIGGVPYLTHYFPALGEIPGLYLPLFSVYIGLMVAGRYYGSVDPPGRRKAVIAAAVFIICIVLNVVGTYFEYRASPSWYLFFDERTSALITIPSICAFILLRYFVKSSEKSAKAWGYISGLTFGAYLLSDLAIKYSGGVFDALAKVISPIPAVIIWELGIFAACLAVTALLKKIPFIKRLL